MDETTKRVTALAADKLHRDWKKQHVAQHGDVPCWKAINRESQAWLDTYPVPATALRLNPESGAPEIDIAALDNFELPPQYSTENYTAASECIENLDLPDLETLAAWTHDSWLDRHRNDPHAQQELLVDYEQLPEPEKEKDRAVVRACLGALLYVWGDRA